MTKKKTSEEESLAWAKKAYAKLKENKKIFNESLILIEQNATNYQIIGQNACYLSNDLISLGNSFKAASSRIFIRASSAGEPKYF